MGNRKSNRPEDAHFIHVPKCAIVSVFYTIFVCGPGALTEKCEI